MAIQFDDDAQFQEYRDIIFEVRAESRHKDRGNIVFPIKVDLPAESMTAEQVIKGLNKFASHVKNYANDLQSIFCKYWEYLRIDYIKSKAEYDFLAGAPDWVKTLEPYLIPIAAEANKDFILADFYRKCFTADWEPIKGSPYFDLIEEAEKRRAEHQKAQALLEITVKHTDLIQYPLDKPNNVIWNLLEAAAPNGQLKLSIDTSKGNSKQGAIILYSIDFANLDPNLHITQQLTPFDKRVYIATASLFNGGNEYMTATQICRQMGNTGRPSKSQLKKINDSLTKMGAARVYLDNRKEAETHKKAKFYKYDAPLLPFERISEAITINGKETDSTIRLLREPPLITFARQREQITTIKRELLESPISKTEANLTIDDYLMTRISRMKNGKGKSSNKMLYETIYKNCNITTKMQKQRAPEKIKNYLDHYKSCDFIKGYKEGKDGITIIL